MVSRRSPVGGRVGVAVGVGAAAKPTTRSWTRGDERLLAVCGGRARARLYPDNTGPSTPCLARSAASWPLVARRPQARSCTPAMPGASAGQPTPRRRTSWAVAATTRAVCQAPALGPSRVGEQRSATLGERAPDLGPSPTATGSPTVQVRSDAALAPVQRASDEGITTDTADVYANTSRRDRPRRALAGSAARNWRSPRCSGMTGPGARQRPSGCPASTSWSPSIHRCAGLARHPPTSPGAPLRDPRGGAAEETMLASPTPRAGKAPLSSASRSGAPRSIRAAAALAGELRAPADSPTSPAVTHALPRHSRPRWSRRPGEAGRPDRGRRSRRAPDVRHFRPAAAGFGSRATD